MKVEIELEQGIRRKGGNGNEWEGGYLTRLKGICKGASRRESALTCTHKGDQEPRGPPDTSDNVTPRRYEMARVKSSPKRGV